MDQEQQYFGSDAARHSVAAQGVEQNQYADDLEALLTQGFAERLREYQQIVDHLTAEYFQTHS